MWSSEHDDGSKKKPSGGKSQSSRVISSSSSSRSYSSSSTNSMIPQTPRRKTIEEVWKDINFTTLHHERPIVPPVSMDHHQRYHHHNQLHRPNPTTSPSFRGMILQDFLAGPFKETPEIPSSTAAEDMPLPLPLPLPPTVLSLNSGAMELHYMGIQPANNHSNTTSNSGSPHAHHHADDDADNHNEPFISHSFSDALLGSPPNGLFSFCSKKRVIESPDIGGGDRRHKRMIKNRESAARSRARKQAYTNELELEVAHLVEENTRLKKEYDELRLAMAAQLHTKKTLQRTSTAPF